MDNSHVKTVDDALDQTDTARTVALVHLRKLSRVKNRIRSPLLRLPTEIIVHILLFVNDRGYHSDWQVIFQACQHVFELMLTQTGVWEACLLEKVSGSSLRTAHIAFVGSNGNRRPSRASPHGVGHQGMTIDAASRSYYWRRGKDSQKSRLYVEIHWDP